MNRILWPDFQQQDFVSNSYKVILFRILFALALTLPSTALVSFPPPTPAIVLPLPVDSPHE